MKAPTISTRSSSGARRPASRLSASLILAALLCAAPASAADVHTVFAELHAPYAANRNRLRKLLKQEGYEAHAEGDREVALLLTAAQIQALFKGRIVVRKVAASSHAGMVDQPYLESAVIPQRLAKYIRRVYLDPQRS